MRGSIPALKQGDEVSPFYDPMIAKLIVKGASVMPRLPRCLTRINDADGRAWSKPTPAFYGQLLQS